jgi:hypothetical protein
MEAEPLPAITVGVDQQRGNTRWGVLLVWFMRLLAIVWLLEGLAQWYVIMKPEPVNFEALPPIVAAITIVFAGINPVAAVGLWLAAPWGGVLWLLATVAQGAVIFLLPELIRFGPLVAIFDFALILIYFLLTYRAALERDI